MYTYMHPSKDETNSFALLKKICTVRAASIKIVR